MIGWQWLHFRYGIREPLVEPLAVERLYLNNYFSIAKARRDLGYQPLFTTEQAMDECLPYYADLFHQMKAESTHPLVAAAAPAPQKADRDVGRSANKRQPQAPKLLEE